MFGSGRMPLGAQPCRHTTTNNESFDQFSYAVTRCQTAAHNLNHYTKSHNNNNTSIHLRTNAIAIQRQCCGTAHIHVKRAERIFTSIKR